MICNRPETWCFGTAMEANVAWWHKKTPTLDALDLRKSTAPESTSPFPKKETTTWDAYKGGFFFANADLLARVPSHMDAWGYAEALVRQVNEHAKTPIDRERLFREWCTEENYQNYQYTMNRGWDRMSR